MLFCCRQQKKKWAAQESLHAFLHFAMSIGVTENRQQLYFPVSLNNITRHPYDGVDEYILSHTYSHRKTKKSV